MDPKNHKNHKKWTYGVWHRNPKFFQNRSKTLKNVKKGQILMKNGQNPKILKMTKKCHFFVKSGPHTRPSSKLHFCKNENGNFNFYKKMKNEKSLLLLRTLITFAYISVVLVKKSRHAKNAKKCYF